MFKTTVDQHLALIKALKEIETEITQSADRLVATLQRGGKVLLMGNGGVPQMHSILRLNWWSGLRKTAWHCQPLR